MSRANRALRNLFPEPRRTAPAWEAVAVGAGVVVLTVVALARQTGVSAVDTLWAEDGRFFLGDALRDPFWATLLRPLGGYAHVGPRLLGEVASWVPLRAAPVVLSGGAALVVALTGAVAYEASGAFLRTRTARVVVAVAPVLLPIASFEVLNAAANLHFVLLYGAFWALLWVPSSWPGRIGAAALVAVTALSDPQAAVLAPLALARLVAWPVRSWRHHVVTAAYAVALAVQFLVDVNTTRGFGERAPVSQLVRLYPLRVVSAVGGGRVVDPVWRALGDGLTVICALAVIAVVAVAWRKAGRDRRPFVLAAAILSVAYWVGPLAFRWSDRMTPSNDAVGLHGSRYGLVPALLVVVLGALAVEASGRRWVRVTALAAVVACAAIGFRADNGRTDGPSWRAAVTAAGSSPCRGHVDVPITPPGWATPVPCGRLTPARAR